MLVDAVLEKKVPDLCMVPITINYEKVMEGDTNYFFIKLWKNIYLTSATNFIKKIHRK